MYKIKNEDIVYAECLARNKHKECRYIDVDELISSAYEGLCIAAKTFNPNFGVKFTTYAYNSIDQQMKKTIKFSYSNNIELIEEEIIDIHSIEDVLNVDFTSLSQEEVDLIDNITQSGLPIYQYAIKNNISDSTLYRKINEIKRKVNVR